jgi:hypothetical protein
MDVERLLCFPTDQRGGRMLALLLDPESQFGADRFAELGLDLDERNAHPVVRVR